MGGPGYGRTACSLDEVMPVVSRDGAAMTGERRARGTCFGYSLESPLDFCSLRDGDGPPLAVGAVADTSVPEAAPMLEWTENQRPYSRLYADGPRYRVWIDGVGWFDVDPAAASIGVSGPGAGPRREVRLLGVPTALCFIARGDLALHAAAADVGGGAVVFAAPGRYGKTTLAGAFLRAGYRPLSEDLTCVRVSGAATVLPGPAVLRVRRDVHERLEFANTTVVAEEADRVYLSIDRAVRGDGTPVPLRGVVLLRHGQGGVRMERVGAQESLRDLWALAFNLPTDADRKRCFGTISALAGRVPVWNLHRRLSYEELPTVIDQIITTCLAA